LIRVEAFPKFELFFVPFDSFVKFYLTWKMINDRRTVRKKAGSVISFDVSEIVTFNKFQRNFVNDVIL